MTATEKYYLDILSQFYEKAISNHPKKLFLLQKKKNKFMSITTTGQKNSSIEKKLIPSLQQKPRLTSSLAKSTKSRDISVDSDKDSNDSRLSQSHMRLKIDEYFKCHFVYESSSFVKALMYSYLLLTANVENIDLLIYLKQNFLEEYSDYFQSAQLHRLEFYWDKIILCGKKKQKYWEKSFMSSFKHFPLQFSNKLFQMTVKVKPQNLYLSNITSFTIKKISQSLGYGLNYYHVSKKFIRSQSREGKQIKFQLNIVYIQQLERWMVSDRPLQKPSQDQSCEKIKHIIGQNISKLLGKYQKDNLILGKLTKILNDQNVKESQNKPVQMELKRNNKFVSLKIV